MPLEFGMWGLRQGHWKAFNILSNNVNLHMTAFLWHVWSTLGTTVIKFQKFKWLIELVQSFISKWVSEEKLLFHETKRIGEILYHHCWTWQLFPDPFYVLEYVIYVIKNWVANHNFHHIILRSVYSLKTNCTERTKTKRFSIRFLFSSIFSLAIIYFIIKCKVKYVELWKWGKIILSPLENPRRSAWFWNERLIFRLVTVNI